MGTGGVGKKEKEKSPGLQARRALGTLLKSTGGQGSSVAQSTGSEPGRGACLSSFQGQLSGVWEKLSPLSTGFLMA